MTTLEVAVETVEEARAAQAGGADSVEISRELARDGLTPDLVLVARVTVAVSIAVHVIIRPHDRGFVYDPVSFVTLLADARALAALPGVNGIVFGAHTADGYLHVDQIAAIRAAIGEKTLTLHRALDTARDAEVGLGELAGVIDRALTSGPAPNADAGRAGLRRWVDQYGDQFAFIAAGGIRREMLPALIHDTGAAGIHVGSAARVDGVVNARAVADLRRRLDGGPS